MDGLKLLYLLFTTFAFHLPSLKGSACKTMEFWQTWAGKALIGHVIKTEWATSTHHCQIKCFMENRCISCNYGLDVNNNEQMCELNEADHVMQPDRLIGRQRTVYKRVENNCNCLAFQVCRVNWLDQSHRCECKHGFAGPTCSEQVSATASTPTPLEVITTPLLETSLCLIWISMSSNSKTYYQAMAECKGKSGTLPSILSVSDNSRVKIYGYYSVNSWIWIGLRKSDGTYKWANSKPLTFTKWKSNPGTGNCVHMESNGKWGKSPCSHTHKFVCFNR